jgi:hypothetical protein
MVFGTGKKSKKTVENSRIFGEMEDSAKKAGF